MYGTRIMISHDTYLQVQNWFVTRPLDVVAVKGKETALKVYELISHVDTAAQDQVCVCVCARVCASVFVCVCVWGGGGAVAPRLRAYAHVHLMCWSACAREQ